jgi:DNA-binding IscR family transcriptional regulator
MEERITELVDHGLLARMAEPEGVGLFKPPELIAVNEVLDLVHGGAALTPGFPQKPGDPIDDLIQRRNLAAAQSLDGMTLHSLIVAQEKAAPRPRVDVQA